MAGSKQSIGSLGTFARCCTTSTYCATFCDNAGLLDSLMLHLRVLPACIKLLTSQRCAEKCYALLLCFMSLMMSRLAAMAVLPNVRIVLDESDSGRV